MAITFVGAGTPVTDDVTAQATGNTFSPHANTLTNDLMIAVIGRDDDNDAWDDPPATGWTIIAQPANTTGRDYRLLLAYKIATSDSESNVTFTGTNVLTNIENSGAILTFRGVDTASPFDVTYSSASHLLTLQNVTNPATHVAKPITTITDGAVVLLAEHTAAAGVTNSADPTGYTNRLRIINNASGNVQVWTKEVATAGTETPDTAGYTLDDIDADGGIITIAMQPADAGGITGSGDLESPLATLSGSGQVVTATVNVAGISGGANLTGLSYAVFSSADIGSATLVKQGNDETTDANGDLFIDLTGTGILNGTVLTIIITDYTTTPTGASKGAVCYATAVAV